MDWVQVISELEARGMTQVEIAAAVGCSQPYISQLRSGKRRDCGFRLGTALQALVSTPLGARVPVVGGAMPAL